MNIRKTDIEGVLIIEPKLHGDQRGWFIESYSKRNFREVGIDFDFVQDNHSMSAHKGTLRGLHFQANPKAQTKLVTCIKGKIRDVVVDLRKGSATYKKWLSLELSEENKKRLLIPRGFAHGFLTLTDDVEVQYKVDEYYAPECDQSIRYDDPELAIDWGINNPILSEKDKNALFLKDINVDFSLKFMLTGVTGQLGHDLVLKLKEMNLDFLAPKRDELDLTKTEQVQDYILKEKPDIIIHCAAYTTVDQAEDEKDLCYKVNVNGTRIIAESAEMIKAKLVYISTDYVFDGSGVEAHAEDKETSPINYYGYSKEQGEKIVRELIDKHFIVRTSWLYGLHGNNFVKTMLNLAETRDEINVVSDQVGVPTFTKDLAELILNLIQTNNYGTYHGVNEGSCSWYDFAKAILEKSGKKTKIKAILTEEYSTKAKRPKNSRLSKEKIELAGIESLPKWEDALNRFLLDFL